MEVYQREEKNFEDMATVRPLSEPALRESTSRYNEPTFSRKCSLGREATLSDNDSDNSTDHNSASLIDEKGTDSDGDESICIPDNESVSSCDELLPDHYRNNGAGLDRRKLRQRRYSPKTNAVLEWVREHCDK